MLKKPINPLAPVENDLFKNFMAIFGKGLIALQDKEGKKGKDFIITMCKSLWRQLWYWEDCGQIKANEHLAMIKNNRASNSKDNHFLIRDGVGKKGTFTLEVLLASADEVMKLTIEDYFSLLEIAKNLITRGFKYCERETSPRFPQSADAELKGKKGDRKDKKKEKEKRSKKSKNKK